MDETVTPSPDSGRILGLFVISTVGLLLALGMDELPFTPATGPFAIVAELLYFLILAVILYAVGRLGAAVGAAHAE